MREKLGLIEPDDTLRLQVLQALDGAGFHADPFEDMQEFMQFRDPEASAVLVGDERVDALGVRESLCNQGQWLAVIGYSERPRVRGNGAFLRGGG